MTYISLREFIDDILLLVRNNNISESEDLSRHQIAVWIRAYKQAILKDRLDKQKEQAPDDDELEDYVDDIFIREKELDIKLQYLYLNVIKCGQMYIYFSFNHRLNIRFQV